MLVRKKQQVEIIEPIGKKPAAFIISKRSIAQTLRSFARVHLIIRSKRVGKSIVEDQSGWLSVLYMVSDGDGLNIYTSVTEGELANTLR